WNVIGLNFTPDALVPSGEYASVFSASDFGNHGWGTMELFTVDNDPPVADAGLDQTVVENTAATFDGSGSSDNVGIVNYTWNFMDNGVPIDVYGVTASYNFTEVGSHEVTLTVTDGAGHMDSATIWVEVVADQPPVADAGPDQLVMGGELVVFDGSGSYDDVNIVNWTWTFDYEGSTVMLYGPNPTFIFWIEDVYDVTLTVNDTAGHTSSDVVQITVSGMIPEFPTLLLPVFGMAAVVLVARLRKRR
ncbi:MAG: PKD domain-containing protein, partial [Thermoplasmata archaeon]